MAQKSKITTLPAQALQIQLACRRAPVRVNFIGSVTPRFGSSLRSSLCALGHGRRSAIIRRQNHVAQAFLRASCSLR